MKRNLLLIALAGVLAVPAVYAQSTTGDSVLGVTVAAEASISITDTAPSLSSSSIWGDYTGSTAFTYSIRTTAATGSGTVKVQFGGPLTNASSDTIALTNLTYGCTVADADSACSSGTATNSGSQTDVASFGADKHVSGGEGTVAWTLVNDPTYKTGTYHATATFTIAAL